MLASCKSRGKVTPEGRRDIYIVIKSGEIRAPTTPPGSATITDALDCGKHLFMAPCPETRRRHPCEASYSLDAALFRAIAQAISSDTGNSFQRVIVTATTTTTPLRVDDYLRAAGVYYGPGF